MRGLLLTSLFALSCAPVVRPDARVAIRRRALLTDQAVAIFHGAQVCSFTLRDASGGLHDLEQRRAGAVPVDMSRAVPDRPWWLQDSRYGATIVTAIAMPPGRYEVVGYAEAKGWQAGTDEKGQATGRTDCPHRWRLDRHEVRLPFAVSPGEVALLDVPGGKPEDWVLRQRRSLLDHIYTADVRDVIQSWKPAILRAEDEHHAAFVSAIRQGRQGYDVYPLCTGPEMTAVVRMEGTVFPWYDNWQTEVLDAFRKRVPVRATSGTGFGGGCVEKRGAFHVYLAEQGELEAAVRAAGEWLARENFQGEIDIIVTGRFVDAGSPPVPPDPGGR